MSRENNMPYQMEAFEAKDCRRIVNVLEERGYILTMKEAWDIWSAYSMDMDAGWIGLDAGNESLFNTVLGAVERIKAIKINFEYLS
jgi:hypothetical protein